jgi:hypothetical protein
LFENRVLDKKKMSSFIHIVADRKRTPVDSVPVITHVTSVTKPVIKQTSNILPILPSTLTTEHSESPRNIWGPLIWKSFHLLCTISDRKDIVYRWRKLLELTTVVMPCAICRTHMMEYLRSHRIFGKQLNKWTIKNGTEVKDSISQGIHLFHNHVNSSNGKPELSFEEGQSLLDSLYTKEKSRREIGDLIIKTLSEVEPYWAKYRPREYSIWYTEFITLIRLCQSGSF